VNGILLQEKQRVYYEQNVRYSITIRYLHVRSLLGLYSDALRGPEVEGRLFHDILRVSEVLNRPTLYSVIVMQPITTVIDASCMICTETCNAHATELTFVVSRSCRMN